MSSPAKLLIAIALVLASAACRKDVRGADLPAQGAVVVPEVVTVVRERYVRIRPELTAQHPIAEGPLSQCPDVAAARKAELQKANAKLREIAGVQGTEVKP